MSNVPLPLKIRLYWGLYKCAWRILFWSMLRNWDRTVQVARDVELIHAQLGHGRFCVYKELLDESEHSAPHRHQP